MYYREFEGINTFLVEMARVLLKEGVERQTRGFTCYELSSPVVIKIKNPTARIITVPARDWNCTLPYVESLWLASGRNDINMVAHYVKKMMDFSDDKRTMRAGYGPRFRYFTGLSDDYNNGYLEEPKNLNDLSPTRVDQFDFVVQCFQKDPLTRQAIITIGDPAKDCFQKNHGLKQTKDFPCTRDLQFIQSNGKLDLIVHMRSNDFVWGASGVNIFNFTFIQEYFAKILGMEIGSYYHIANNFHYYEDKKEMVQRIADTSDFEDSPFLYSKSFSTLKEFNDRLLAFQNYEYSLRSDKTNRLIDFDDDFFNDWAKVLFHFKNKSNKNIKYVNGTLGDIVKKRNSKAIKENNRQQLIDAIKLNPDGVSQDFWRQYI